MGTRRTGGTYLTNEQPRHQINAFAGFTEQQQVIVNRAAAKGLLLEVFRKVRNELLILFVYGDTPTVEKFLVEHLVDIPGFGKALKMAEQR